MNYTLWLVCMLSTAALFSAEYQDTFDSFIVTTTEKQMVNIPFGLLPSLPGLAKLYVPHTAICVPFKATTIINCLNLVSHATHETPLAFIGNQSLRTFLDQQKLPLIALPDLVAFSELAEIERSLIVHPFVKGLMVNTQETDKAYFESFKSSGRMVSFKLHALLKTVAEELALHELQKVCTLMEETEVIASAKS